MTESEAKKEIEHNVFCNTDNFEMTISKECYKTIINALEKREKIKEIIANANQWSKEDIVVKAQAYCDIEKILRSDKRMSDLISRSKIRDYIKTQINPYGKPFEGTAYELGLKIMRYIDAMDSVYDIDKIVEELKTDSSVKLYGSQNSDNYMIPVNRAIEIVKKCGVADD